MAAVTRNDMNANVLQTWLYKETLENLRSKLYFHELGDKPIAQDGYNTLSWATFTKLTQTNVTKGTTSNDGVTPDDTAFNASVITCTPFQLRIVVNLSDQVIARNKIDFLSGAAVEVGYAMAERIDYEIQAVIMAGTNYIYSSATHSTRATLASGDEVTFAYVAKAVAWLRAQSAPTYDDSYVAIVHPYTAKDLRNDTTSAANWIDPSKYTTPENMFKGEIGKFGGVRFIECGYVQALRSTGGGVNDVFPTLILGRGAYGVADFDTLQAYLTPDGAEDSDPLNQRRKVGAKVAFNSVILNQSKMIRIESYSTVTTIATT